MNDLDKLVKFNDTPDGTPHFITSASTLDPVEFQNIVETFIQIGNEKAMGIKIKESREKLIDITKIPQFLMSKNILGFEESDQHLLPLVRMVREGIFERLQRIHNKLLPYNLGLKLFYGLRPIKMQMRIIDQAKEAIRKERLDLVEVLNEVEIERLSIKYAAPISLAPHCTGGAVDLCIYDIHTGHELDFGTPFAQFTPESMTEHPSIMGKARFNRLLLRALMAQEGFWNYPAEWWHFSHGDCAWASFTHQPHAIYGPVQQSRIQV